MMLEKQAEIRFSGLFARILTKQANQTLQDEYAVYVGFGLLRLH